MLPGLSGIGVLPVAVPDADYSVPSLLGLLFADPDAEYTFLLIAEPLDLSTVGSLMPYPVGTYPVESGPDSDVLPGTPVYLSDRGFATGADDDPAHQPFPPRLITPYTFESSIPLPGSGETRGTASFGAIEIANHDGTLDASMLNATLAGRAVTVKIGGVLNKGRAGERAMTYAEYGILIKGTCDSVTWTDTRITIALRDSAQKLERPVQTETYAGTGDEEGGSELAGVLKPLLWGIRRNLPAVPIDTLNDVYQVHAGGVIQAVLAVRDKGVALAFSGTDYADYDALVAATRGSGQDIDLGEYATCLAEGMIRLGAPPDGTVTMDARGDAVGGYVSTAAEIAVRIAVRQGKLWEADEVDGASKAAAAVSRPAEVGLWTGTEAMQVTDALDQLMGSVDGWWLFARDGRLTLGVHVDPAGETSIADITEDQVIEGSPQRLATPEPVRQYRLGYRPLGITQSADALATSLTPAQKAVYANPQSFAIRTETSIPTVFRSARALEIATLIDDPADADDEVDRRIVRDREARNTYSIDKKRLFFQHRPGDVVTLSLPLFGLDEGQQFTVLRVAEDASTLTTTLDLWG